MRMFLSSKRTTWPSCECQAGFWMSGAALCSSQQLAAKVAFWRLEEISFHLSETWLQMPETQRCLGKRRESLWSITKTGQRQGYN